MVGFDLRRVLCLSMIATLTGCGGDRNASPPTIPQNRAPVFTSSASIGVPEDNGGVIYTAAAADADDDPLLFSLSGGADQSLFSITQAGALTFAGAPDFEAPADADSNNVYLVQIAVTDGLTNATLDLAVTIANVGPDGFRVARVGSGFSQPLYLAAVPGGRRVFVVEKGGHVRILDPVTGVITPTPFLDLGISISTDGERGLLGFTTAPDFTVTGRFYVFVTNPAGDIEIRAYRTLAGNRDQADPASGDVILVIPHPTFSNHNGGWLDFGPDGMLYLAVGDGGGGGDPDANAQNPNLLLGKLARIDVSSDAFPADPMRDYAIPPGNAFAQGGGRQEILALGLRNPFRAGFDRVTGNLYIGDVGQNEVEEIDLVRPSQGSVNFGWPFLEGTRPFRGTGPASLAPPVAEYFRGSGPREGQSVTGGYVYRGPVEALRGQYFFGDFVSGNIWSLPTAMLKFGATVSSDHFILRRQAFAPAAGAIGNISSFGLDEAGNLYIVDFDGEIFRLEAL